MRASPSSSYRSARAPRAWNKSAATHPLEYDGSENPRAEDFENAYYVRDRYRPTCMRVKGEGAELSRVVCRRPEQ